MSADIIPSALQAAVYFFTLLGIALSAMLGAEA